MLNRVVKSLAWIVRNSIDAATMALAIDCLAICAEYGVIDAGGFREEVWKSTSRLCEYNGTTLWDHDDFDILFGNNIQTWIVRSRRSGSKPKSEDEVYAGGPWLTTEVEPVGNNEFLSGYRLRQLFNGMSLQDSACEICALAEELLEFVTMESNELPEEGMTVRQKRQERERFDKPRVFETSIVIDLTISVIQTAFTHLQALQSETLNMEAVSLAYWLLRALKAITATMNEVPGGDRHVTGMASAVANGKVVADGLLTMYNSEGTDVRSLDARTLREMREIGGVKSNGE